MPLLFYRDVDGLLKPYGDPSGGRMMAWRLIGDLIVLVARPIVWMIHR